MKFTPAKLAGSFIIELEKRTDERGFFARQWCQKELAAQGLSSAIAQINVGASPRPGTLRGMHFQKAPFAEVKIVHCTRGAVFDVLIDLRVDSPTYRDWMGVELNAAEHRLVYAPEGCAHGYLTLAPESEVTYFTSQFYAPEAACGVRYDDPAFGVKWPRSVEVISAADRSWPAYAPATGG